MRIDQNKKTSFVEQDKARPEIGSSEGGREDAAVQELSWKQRGREGGRCSSKAEKTLGVPTWK